MAWDLIILAWIMALIPLAAPLPFFDPSEGLSLWQGILAAVLINVYLWRIILKHPISLNPRIITSCATTTALLFLAFNGQYQPINWAEVMRLVIIVWTIPWLKRIIRVHGVTLVATIACSTLLLHSQWAIVQFITQHDLGLYILGESRLSIDRNSVAKFYAGPLFNKLIRAYGPYPHANILAGSLLVGLMISYALPTSSKKWLLITRLILFIGIFFTFSRAALFGALIIMTIGLFTSRKKSEHKKIDRIIFLCVAIFLIFLSPLVSSRFHDPEDKAIFERLKSVEWSVSIIKNLELEKGLGLGKYRAALNEYLMSSNISHDSWQVDYVHSVPLLLIAEWGTIYFFIVLILSSVMIWRFLYRHQQRRWRYLFFLGLTPLLIFDHYLATQSAPLLWVILLVMLVGAWVGSLPDRRKETMN